MKPTPAHALFILVFFILLTFGIIYFFQKEIPDLEETQRVPLIDKTPEEVQNYETKQASVLPEQTVLSETIERYQDSTSLEASSSIQNSPKDMDQRIEALPKFSCLDPSGIRPEKTATSILNLLSRYPLGDLYESNYGYGSTMKRFLNLPEPYFSEIHKRGPIYSSAETIYDVTFKNTGELWQITLVLYVSRETKEPNLFGLLVQHHGMPEQELMLADYRYYIDKKEIECFKMYNEEPFEYQPNDPSFILEELFISEKNIQRLFSLCQRFEGK